MIEKFSIQSGSREPIFRQIVTDVCRMIDEGQLSQGDALPSIRELARALVINHNTVSKAYADLAGRGIIESIPGKSYVVSDKRQVLSSEEIDRRLQVSLSHLINEARLLGLDQTQLQAWITDQLSSEYSSKRKQP